MSSSLPSVILSLDKIPNISYTSKDENEVYLYENRQINKIRILATVLFRRESITKSGTPMLSLTLDDSTSVIRMNVWKRDKTSYDVYQDVEKIKIGSIVEILGWIKRFNDEFYIQPILIKNDLSIVEEISRRIKLLIDAKQTQSVTGSEVEIDERYLDFLKYFEEDLTLNNVENLCIKSGLTVEEVTKILNQLSMYSLIIKPQEGYYKKLS